MNRRQFFKTIAAATAAVVAPSVWARGAGFYDFKPFPTEADRLAYRANLPKPPVWMWCDAPVEVNW